MQIKTKSVAECGYKVAINDVAKPCPKSLKATDYEHHEAVCRVIISLMQHIDHPQSLAEMAKVAHMSPFHFCRVFRQLIGVPPLKFAAALRIEAAKRLLLNTDIPITDICFAVGYTSVGTFTTHFTRDVGLSPRAFRNVVEDGIDLPHISSNISSNRGATINGNVCVATETTINRCCAGLIFIGVFPEPIPSGVPIACTVLSQLGPFQILCPVGASDRDYYLYGVMFDSNQQLKMRQGESGETIPLLVGNLLYPIRLYKNTSDLRINQLVLRFKSVTDPPLLFELPSLYAIWKSKSDSF